MSFSKNDLRLQLQMTGRRFSPNLNPYYYCIWDILQDLMYEGWWLSFAIYRTQRGYYKQM